MQLRRLAMLAAAIATTLLSTSSLAQTVTTTAVPNLIRGGIDTILNCANAKDSYIPVFASSTPINVLICNSVMYQAGSDIGIGTTTPVAALDVHGAVNASLYYQVGGSTTLSIGSPADGDLFLGVGAGSNNVVGHGTANTFTGALAGSRNTTGNSNTFSGTQAGQSNTIGAVNTFTGAGAGQSNTTEGDNTFSGYNAGRSNNTAGANTFSGSGARQANTTGGFNAFYGFQAGLNNTTGSNDVYIANLGPASGDESNTIRIGDPNNQAVAYIAGIYGVNVGGIPVRINSNG